jgi:hypothetical protein
MNASRPRYYRRDGSPLMSTSDTQDLMQFAKLFEDKTYRIVEVSYTLYGERLSTVWLGIDHNFSFNPLATPLIFETMIFAPVKLEDRRAAIHGKATLKYRILQWLYPHESSFQLRYATEDQARAGHRRTKLQCLIPPLLRRLILYRIGKDSAWS